MISYLSRQKNESGEYEFRVTGPAMKGSDCVLLCDDSFLHDPDEPISRLEVEQVNMFTGAKILKIPRVWRSTQSRADAVALVMEWVRSQR